MFKKMGMTLVVVGAITLAGCVEASSSTPASSSEASSSVAVDPALAKLQSAYDSLGGLVADPTNITTGFQVPVNLANGVTATWTSAEPGVLGFSTTPVNGLINATVNRPAKDNGDAAFNIFADLSIAAELTAGNLTLRWTQAVTVKQNTVELIVINSIADILALRDSSLDRTLNVTLANLTIFARSGGEAFAYDGTGIIQIYRGAAENLTVGRVYTVSGLIDWYFGIWEIVDSTAEEQVNATPQTPTKETVTGVLGKVNRLTGEGAHLSAGQNAAAGNFEPIYARVTGKVAIIADRPANYNTYILDKDMEPAAFVAGAGTVPANALLVYYQTVDYNLIKAFDGIEITIDVVIYTFRSDQRAFAVYYVGGPTGITANLTDAQAQTIDAAALSLPASITDATTLTLPATGTNGGSAITWSSSNSDVINVTTGAVTIPNPAVVVTVTASILKGEGPALVRTFEVVVGLLENTTMAALLTKSVGNVAYSEAEVVYLAADKRSAVLADATGYGYIFNSVALDITLGQFIGASYTVGIYRGLVQMTAVKLVAPKGVDSNITPAAQVMTATEASPLTSAAAWAPAFVTMTLFGYASGNFTNGYLSGFGTNFIQTNNAPTSLRDKKFTVTGWLTGRGSATPAQSLTLISTLDYAAVATAATDPTDAEKLALATQRYVAPVANPTLTSNLTLPTTYTVPGTTIVANLVWTSNNPSVISNSGEVTRPAFGQPDANVTLSYVMSIGAQENAAVQIAYTVIAAEQNQSAQPVVVTAAYPGGSTTNMQASPANNAASIGLDASLFTVLSIKNGASTEIGLNTAGQIRLYALRTDGNGSTLSIAIGSGYAITGVEIVFGASTNSPTANLVLGSQTTALIAADLLNTTKTYSSLDVTSFSLKNTQNTGGTGSNAQIYILSIKITYIAQA